jgi:hypothetical protein
MIRIKALAGTLGVKRWSPETDGIVMDLDLTIETSG